MAPMSKTYVAGEPRKIVSDGRKNDSPAWSGDGRDLIFSAGELALAGMYRIRADGSIPPVRIGALGSGVTEPALSASGHQLAFSRTFRNASIWRLDLGHEGHRPVQIVASSSYRDVFPQYSPDGSKVAFFSNRTGENQIWLCNADGTQPVQLTSMSGITTGTPPMVARWTVDLFRLEHGRFLADLCCQYAGRQASRHYRRRHH